MRVENSCELASGRVLGRVRIPKPFCVEVSNEEAEWGEFTHGCLQVLNIHRLVRWRVYVAEGELLAGLQVYSDPRGAEGRG